MKNESKIQLLFIYSFQFFYASCICISPCYFFSYTYLEIVNISTLENSQAGYLGGKFNYFPKAMASSVFLDLGISQTTHSTNISLPLDLSDQQLQVRP